MQELIKTLESKKGFRLSMIIGLDGFVDEIIHMVDKRQDHNNFTRIKTIEEFGNRIVKAAGLSTNIERVPVQVKLGGNGPILSNALLEYGVELVYVGALGKPAIHPVFNPIAERAKAVYSLSEPAYTDALEFEDGKLLFGKMTVLKELTWEACKKEMGGADGIAKMIDECDLFGMENWTMVPLMSEIWEGLIKEVFPLMKKRADDAKPIAFFDLADPEKRTREDILHAMKLISTFEERFRTVLGLNEKELYEIADVFGVKADESRPEEEKFKNTLMATAGHLNIYCLVVHPVKSAACCIGGEYYSIEGPYCAKPVLTTGAGDNFNAGFCLGQSLGLDPLSALTLGVCTSGFYVRNAKSPAYDDVIRFIRQWDAGKVE